MSTGGSSSGRTAAPTSTGLPRPPGHNGGVSRPPRGNAPDADTAATPTLAATTQRILDANGHVSTSDLLHTGFKDEQRLADAFQQLGVALGLAGGDRKAVVNGLVRSVPDLSANPRKDLDAQVRTLELARALTRTLSPAARDEIACAACEVAREIVLAAHDHSFMHELQAAGRQYGARAFSGKIKYVSVPMLPVTTAVLAVGALAKATSKSFKEDKTANKALHLVADAIRDRPGLSDKLAEELVFVFMDPWLRGSQHVRALRKDFAAKANPGQLLVCNAALIGAEQATLS